MNRIVIELAPEDRQRLDNLFYNLAVLVERLPIPAPPADPNPAVNAVFAAAFAAEHPADVATAPFDPPAPAPVPVAVAPAPAPISLGEFQKAIVTRCAESTATKEKVQALINQYAESVSAIPEAKRPEVLAALSQI